MSSTSAVLSRTPDVQPSSAGFRPRSRSDAALLGWGLRVVLVIQVNCDVPGTTLASFSKTEKPSRECFETFQGDIKYLFQLQLTTIFTLKDCLACKISKLCQKSQFSTPKDPSFRSVMGREKWQILTFQQLLDIFAWLIFIVFVVSAAFSQTVNY